MSPAVPLFALAFAGALVGLSFEVGPWLPAGGAGLMFALAARAQRQTRRALCVLVFTFACATAVAALAQQRHERTAASLPHGERVVVEGVVDDLAPTRTGGRRLLLEASGFVLEGGGEPLVARLAVHLPASLASLDIAAGDRVRVRGRVHRLAPADAPGQLDAERFGLARGFCGRMSVWDPTALVVMERGAEMAPFAHARLSLRERLLALVTPREAGVVLALLVGDTSLFDDEQLELYRRVGAGHLLAVSGLQVTLLAVLLQRALLPLWLLVPLVARRGHARRLAALGALAGVWCFVLLCGAPPSAVRAAGMATAALMALVSSASRARGLDALSIAGLITVMLSPTSVIDPSFLLSYAAVLGLLLAQPAGRELSLEEPGPGFGGVRWDQRRRAVLAGVAVTFGAGLLTLPLSAHLFGAVAPGGVIANLVLVPAAALLQIPAMGLGLAGALAGLAPVAALGAASAGMLEALCAALDPLLGGVVPLTAPGGLTTFGLTLAAALLVVGAVRGPRGPLLSAAAALIAALLLPSLAWRDELRITALPVGQGDGAVFELPDGRVFVIDGGGTWDERWDPGERVMLPFLARRGIGSVDVVVLSHPHPDHLLGLLPVLERLPVKELWHPGYDDDNALMRRLLAAARRRGVAVRSARELLGTHRFGAVEVDVLAPAPEDGAALYEELHENDNSLVLRVRHGADAALWTGDVERWGERYLLASGGDVRATLVKAPHHGSKTSSTAPFVRATGARHVLFTTGTDNQWGFPHAEVESRWREAGARVWDTARNGELTFRLTGRGIVVEPFRGGD